MVHKKIEQLSKIPQFEQRSPEWFEQRKDKLTSSDAATVLGTNPYCKEEELLFKKCGIEKPFTSNIATLHGQKYEDEAIAWYSKITNRTNYDFGLLCYQDVYKENKNVNKEHFFLAGSPDGIAINNNDPDEEPVLIEVKCPFKRPIKTGYIPVYYVPQVQLNMYICDLHVADFIEYCPRKRIINIVRIVRDENWLNKHIPILQEFWNKVIYYRENGIDKHISYNKRIKREEEREQKKQKKLEEQIKVENILDFNENNNDDEFNAELNEIRNTGFMIREI
jgi:putative phage-type endonuclease